MEADREQVLERALPFREGEEVYLEIIEPHMYSAGDAVAKVDGYIISVRDATTASVRSAWCGSRRSAAPRRSRD